MAGKTFKLSIVVDATTAKATKGLGDLGKVVAGVGAAAVGLGTVAVGGIVAAGSALTKLAVSAAPLQGIEAAFEGIVEASGKIPTEMLANLQAGSAGMITQRDLMMKYNLAAQLVGDQFANQLPEAMGFLGKVAAATGEDMGYMMDSLVRGVGRLSPMILDNLGIQVNLTEANEAYAAVLGKTAAELTKSEQQTALMNQVMEKLAVNTANMPEVMGTAATRLAKLGAGFQDFKDRIGKAVLPILNQFLGMLGDAAMVIFPKVAEAVEGLVGKFMEWQEKVLPILLERLGKVWNWITAVGIPKLKDLALTLVNFVIPVFQFFRGKVLPGLLQVAKTVWGWFSETAIPILTNFAQVLLTVVDEGGILDDWFAQLPRPVQIVAEVLAKLILKLHEWGQAIRERLGPIIARFVNEVLPALRKKATEIWDWIVSVAIPRLKMWGAAIAEKLAPHVEKLKEILGILLGKAKEVWGWIVTTAIPQLKEWGTALKTEVLDIFERFTTEVLPVWQQKFDEVWTEAKTNWDQFWEGFKPSLDEMYEDLMAFVEWIYPELEKTWGTLGTLWETIKTYSADLLAALELLTKGIAGTNTEFGVLVGTLLEVGLEVLIGLITAAVIGLNSALEGMISLLQTGREQMEAFAAFMEDNTLMNFLRMFAGVPGGPRGPMGIPLPGLPGFQFGGTMPGAPGQAGLAILHGGETVTPAGGERSVSLKGEAIQLLRAIAAKNGIVVVEAGTGEGGRAADHLLSLGDRAWALPSGA